MSTIVGDISSSVPGPPASGPAAQFLGQSAGFASALATAQGLTNSSQGSAHGVPPAGPAATGANVPGGANASAGRVGNVARVASISTSVSGKKLVNSAPAGAANLGAAANPVVPGVVVPVISSLSSPVTLPAPLPASRPDGGVVSNGNTAAANVADQTAAVSSGSTFGDRWTNAVTPGQSLDLVNGPAVALQSATSANASTTIPGEFASGITPSSVPGASGLLSVNASDPSNVVGIAAGASKGAAFADQFAPALAGPGSGLDPQTNSSNAAGADAAPGLLASAAAANGNPSAETAASNAATAATLFNLPAQAGAMSAVLSGQVPASSILALTLPGANGKPAVPVAAARASTLVTNPIARTEQGGTAASVALSASPSAGSASDPSAIGSQTPFAVFFAASGTESAAGTLPKMMLPPNGAAPPANQTSLGAAAAAKSTTAAGGVGQPASAQNNKGASAGAGSPAPITPTQPTIAISAASAQPNLGQTNPGQSVGAQGPTSAASGGIAVQAAVVENALPKNNLPNLASSGGPVVAQPAEMPAMPAAGPVQMAQLVSQAGQSEMRIGMNTTAFGSVEVRTVVHANDVGLVIGSEKGDLRTLLANELPAITSSLQQQNLRLNSVSYMQSFAFSNNFSGGGGSQPRSFVPPAAPGYAAPVAAADDPAESASMAAFVGGSSSLSILA